MRPNDDFTGLVQLLCEQLRLSPSTGRVRNALQHMWGYLDVESGLEVERWTNLQLLHELQARALLQGIAYLLESTDLGELGSWLGGEK